MTTAANMPRVLLVLVCLGALEAKVHIPLRPRAEVPQAMETPAGEPAPVTQLLDNIKAKGVQAFVGEVSVGTPPQMMSVTFDIASTFSYVPSVNCDDPFCKTRRRYNSSASSTYEANGTAFEAPYGLNVSGVLSKDSIGVAGVTVQGQTFGEANAMWYKWLGVLPQDGVLGLGFDAPAREGILDSMAAQGLIPERVFGIWMGRNPAGGEVTLGGLNEDLYSGELTWVNRTQPAGQSWAFPAQNISLEGHPELGLCPGGDCFVMPISSTPYFITSFEKAKAINSALGGVDTGEPGSAFLDCTTLYQLPTLKIEIGGRTMEMSPFEYTFVNRFENGLQLCISGFIGVPFVNDQVWLMGTLFMQKFYTAYDRENERLGFADSV